MTWYVELQCLVWKHPVLNLVLWPLLILGRIMTVLLALFFGVEMKWQIAREGRKRK